MEIKGNDRVASSPNTQIIQQRTLFSTLLDAFVAVLKFFLIPFKFAADKARYVAGEQSKRNAFARWFNKENKRYRRGFKLNDEF